MPCSSSRSREHLCAVSATCRYCKFKVPAQTVASGDDLTVVTDRTTPLTRIEQLGRRTLEGNSDVALTIMFFVRRVPVDEGFDSASWSRSVGAARISWLVYRTLRRCC